MKLFLLPVLALAFAACDKVTSSEDPTPAPAAATPPPSPTPKPGAWMNQSKSGLDRSGALGEHGGKPGEGSKKK